jgi:hypothetical protein
MASQNTDLSSWGILYEYKDIFWTLYNVWSRDYVGNVLQADYISVFR